MQVVGLSRAGCSRMLQRPGGVGVLPLGCVRALSAARAVGQGSTRGAVPGIEPLTTAIFRVAEEAAGSVTPRTFPMIARMLAKTMLFC